METYDAVIVGGRVAGAALAARLGAMGLRVAIVEKATFPSYPAVSSPFLLPHTLAELDDLGLSPDQYAPGAPRLDEVVLEFGPWFAQRLPLPACNDRSWFVVADRSDFDHALWEHLASFPTVERLEGAAVARVLVEDGTDVGVEGTRDGEPFTLRARIVVGADGRFSRVARDVGAEVVHQRTDADTTIHYAFWEGVKPYDDGPTVAHIYACGDGWSVVFMPIARDRVSVVVQAASDRHAAETGDAETIYERVLREHPSSARRLEGATRVTALSGMKRMGNLFRQATGPGWALVGDAWHQKDSIDAQGVYDALYGARILAGALSEHLVDGKPWDEAGSAYESTATAHLRPMFDATIERVKREIVSVPPPIAARTALRWLITDPEYTRRFGQMVTRTRDPNDFVTPTFLLGALGRGIWADLTGAQRGL